MMKFKQIETYNLSGANCSSMVRHITIINESGLYNAILGSKKPQAKTFKKWVTSEILPSIRKHGMYATEAMQKRLIDLASEIGELKQESLKAQSQNEIER